MHVIKHDNVFYSTVYILSNGISDEGHLQQHRRYANSLAKLYHEQGADSDVIFLQRSWGYDSAYISSNAAYIINHPPTNQDILAKYDYK